MMRLTSRAAVVLPRATGVYSFQRLSSRLTGGVAVPAHPEQTIFPNRRAITNAEQPSVKETGIQKNLWPDKNSTDPITVEKAYDAAAKSYSEDALADGWKASFDHVLPEIGLALSRGSKVILDAGCATGLLADLYTFPEDVVLHGVDISADCLAIARAGGKYTSLQTANLEERLPFDPETFDLAVCNGVLGYCASNKPLAELARVLKPGGHMLVTMRHQQFQERGYPDALQDSNCDCALLRTAVFDPFPNNDAYGHDYVFALIQKKNAGQPQLVGVHACEEKIQGSTYCPYDSTSQSYDTTRKPLGLGTVLGALALNESGKPLASQRILDVGCGTGSFLEAIVGKVGEAVGVDASDGMLANARARPVLQKYGVSFCKSSANQLPFPDSSFDGVTTNQVIHHFPKEDDYRFLYEYLGEAFRVLRPGGCLVINTSSPEQQRDAFWWMALFPRASEEICSRFPPIETLKMHMLKIGFEVDADSVILPQHRTLMGANVYLKDGVDSAFSAEYRAGDSSWAMAESMGELEDGLTMIRELKASGKADAWLREREALRLQIGQSTSLVARKPLAPADI